MVQSLTGVGLVWLFPCAAWKGATYCFTTKITNYFIEGWSCRELSGRPRCGAGAGGTAPRGTAPALAPAVAQCGPSRARREHTVPTGTGEGGTSGGEGGRGRQALTRPHGCLSPSMLTPPPGPHPLAMPRDPQPRSRLSGGRTGSVQWMLASASCNPSPWLRVPVMPRPECSASSGNGSLCRGFLCRGTRWEPARVPAPLPCPPEPLTHRLASQPALRVPQDAAPRWHPLSGAPAPPPQGDLLTAPTIARLIKILKQQVHFPGQCPAVAAHPSAPSLVPRAGGAGGSRAGGARSLEPSRTWALCLRSAGRTSSENDPHKTKQQLFGG